MMTSWEHKIYSNVNDLLKEAERWKLSNQKIVFTNGVFDLLHLGHVVYLQEAKSLGDKLIVGINSDASVKRLKGESRPYNDQISRTALVAAMSMVDAVIIFDQNTPKVLIENISPDVLVKGGDYSIEAIVGHQHVLSYGGTVRQLSFVEGYSSSTIINKIKSK